MTTHDTAHANHSTVDHASQADHVERDPERGRHSFSFTYDDTGDTTTVVAPNGWTMQRVVDAAYEQLGETAQADDRVEYGDGRVLTPEQRPMHVKAFIEAGLAPDRKFHIVSRPGGALR
jgi:hypothetical protein